MADTSSRFAGTRPQWGPPSRAATESKFLKGSLTAVTVCVAVTGFALAFIPGVSNMASLAITGVSHLVDRLKNSVTASDEHEYRARYYSKQIFKTLGVPAREGQYATVKQFKQAAAMNPEIAKLYNAPLKEKSKENTSSFMVNGAIAAATSPFVLGSSAVAGAAKIVEVTAEGSKIVHAAKTALPVVKHMVGIGAAGLAGGAIANAISGDVVDPQKFLEAIHSTAAEARAQGLNMREVLSPNLIFMLRVSQDAMFAKHIKEVYGKGFHQMNHDEQTKVMLANPALANAATTEAYAVANGILQVQELGASKPNLNGVANQYAVGTRNSSFADMVQSRRAAPMQGIAPSV